MKEVMYEVWSDTMRLGRFDTQKDAEAFFDGQVDAAMTCGIAIKLYIVESIVLMAYELEHCDNEDELDVG